MAPDGAGEEPVKASPCWAGLGPWLFGFIHPYMDGNGRRARFVMNLMMASGGYPWTILRTSRRKPYLDALEEASVDQNILPFAQFIREEMRVDWTKEAPEGRGSTFLGSNAKAV